MHYSSFLHNLNAKITFQENEDITATAFRNIFDDNDKR